MSLPVVAVVGRPNVGKSTLLNRIVGRREAIVEERPGVTRDRKEVAADWRGRPFLLVDTGGWLPGGTALDEKVSRQSEVAIAEADVILFVVDVAIGIAEEDARVAELLRRSTVPVLLAVNKVDGVSREAAVWEFVRLGVGDPYPVSALHGRGTGDLLDALVDALPSDRAIPIERTAAMHAMTNARNAYDRKKAGGAFPRPNLTTTVSKKLPRGHTAPHQIHPRKGATTSGPTMQMTAPIATRESKIPPTKNANKTVNEYRFHTRANFSTVTLLVVINIDGKYRRSRDLIQ